MIFACPTDVVVGHVFSKLREGALSQFIFDTVDPTQFENKVRGILHKRRLAYNGICRSVELVAGPANQFSLSLLPPTGEQDNNIRLGISVPWFDLPQCGLSSFDEMQSRLDALIHHIQTVFE